MGRQKIPDGQKLVQAAVTLPPDAYDYYDRLARSRRVSLSRVLRAVLLSPFRKHKIPPLTPQA